MSIGETGRYIVIEGTDGSGTTTQKDLLAQHFENMGQAVVEIFEPGGTPIGQEIRKILKDASLERDPQTNLDLFVICRRELARQVISVALAEDRHVLSDRNWLSSIAYQGFAEGVSIEDILTVNQEALGDYFMPDHTVIIDVPVDVSMTRMNRRATGAMDYFEQRGRPFFDKVRNGYLWCANEFGFPVIDGTKSIEEVHKEIVGHLGKVALLS